MHRYSKICIKGARYHAIHRTIENYQINLFDINKIKMLVLILKILTYIVRRVTISTMCTMAKNLA